MKKQEQVPAQLQVALDEIRSVMEKHDMAGMAVVHCPSTQGGPGFCGHVEVLGPTYSCVELEGQQVRLRPLPPPSIVGDDPDLPRKQVIRNTLNMLHNIRTRMQALIMVFAQTETNVRAKFETKPPDNRKNGHNPMEGLVL